MPFTPFHFGPGLLGKSLAPHQFSITAFVVTQVVVDLEPLYHLVRHEVPVHGPVHSMLVAGSVGAVVGTLVAALHRLELVRRLLSESPGWFRAGEFDAWPCVLGGVLGGVSHSLLDATMHADVQPYWPWSGANPLLSLVDPGVLQVACVVAGMAAVGLLALRGLAEKRTA